VPRNLLTNLVLRDYNAVNVHATILAASFSLFNTITYSYPLRVCAVPAKLPLPELALVLRFAIKNFSYTRTILKVLSWLIPCAKAVCIFHNVHDFFQSLLVGQKALPHPILIVFPLVFHDFLVLVDGGKRKMDWEYEDGFAGVSAEDVDAFIPRSVG
jgi:hypothetical protein